MGFILKDNKRGGDVRYISTWLVMYHAGPATPRLPDAYVFKTKAEAKFWHESSNNWKNVPLTIEEI